MRARRSGEGGSSNEASEDASFQKLDVFVLLDNDDAPVQHVESTI